MLPSGKPTWPGDVERTRSFSSKGRLPISKWNAQWQQNPTAEEGAIFKREWWNVYDGQTIPALDYVIQSYDTAYTKKEPSLQSQRGEFFAQTKKQRL